MLVIQAVKTIAAIAAVAVFTGQRQPHRLFGLSRMEGSVEAGDLRHLRCAPPRAQENIEPGGHVERREAQQALEVALDLIIDDHRAGVKLASMHDPMTERVDRRRVVTSPPEPIEDEFEGLGMPDIGRHRILDAPAIGHEIGMIADPADLRPLPPSDFTLART